MHGASLEDIFEEVAKRAGKSSDSCCPALGLDWHAHPGGQVLLMTEGIGFYQEKGQPKQLVRQGDVVRCPAGVEHWHGASPEGVFEQVAITNTAQGPVLWLEVVTEEEYLSK